MLSQQPNNSLQTELMRTARRWRGIDMSWTLARDVAHSNYTVCKNAGQWGWRQFIQDTSLCDTDLWCAFYSLWTCSWRQLLHSQLSEPYCRRSVMCLICACDDIIILVSDLGRWFPYFCCRGGYYGNHGVTVIAGRLSAVAEDQLCRRISC